MKSAFCFVMTSLLTAATPLLADPPKGYNYDEASLPAYTLPEVLPASVKTPEDWKSRRIEILALLEKEQYGKMPALPSKVESRISLPAGPAIAGKATRSQVTLSLPNGREMDVLIYLPANPKGPVPLFWGMNFAGNHAVEVDPAIPLQRSWTADSRPPATRDNKPNEKDRGKESSRWQIETALDAGFGVATACYNDVLPDFDPATQGEGNSKPADTSLDATGAVATWAWGLRIGLNHFETIPAIDSKRVVVMGHSRLGKAALWAGAVDERFAAVISNESGEGGAALHKRIFGETITRINTSFPHWFCGNFKKYNDKEADLPFDQHFVLAAIAPRPLLITSATEDLWADPNGEFLAAFHAAPVWQLLGQEGIAASKQPAPDNLVNSRVAYHLRSGKHDVTLADWKSYIAFADKHLPKP